jgi:hypothetical protein
MFPKQWKNNAEDAAESRPQPESLRYDDGYCSGKDRSEY